MRYLLSLFLLLSLNAGAQDSSALHRRNYGSRIPLSVYVEPSALLSLPSNMCFRMGVDVPLLQRIGASIALSSYGGNQYGFKAAAKYYLHTGARPTTDTKGWFRGNVVRDYFAVEYGYKDYSYTVQDSLRGIGPLEYHVSKYASTCSLLFGQVETMRCGLYFDWYTGIGIREKTAQNTLTQAQQDNLYHWHEGMTSGPTDSNCDHVWVPHIALCFRVGYRFR